MKNIASFKNQTKSDKFTIRTSSLEVLIANLSDQFLNYWHLGRKILFDNSYNLFNVKFSEDLEKILHIILWMIFKTLQIFWRSSKYLEKSSKYFCVEGNHIFWKDFQKILGRFLCEFSWDLGHEDYDRITYGEIVFF